MGNKEKNRLNAPFLEKHEFVQTLLRVALNSSKENMLKWHKNQVLGFREGDKFFKPISDHSEQASAKW